MNSIQYTFDYDRDVLKRNVLSNFSMTDLERVKEAIKDYPNLSISMEAYSVDGKLLKDSFAVINSGNLIDLTKFWETLRRLKIKILEIVFHQRTVGSNFPPIGTILIIASELILDSTVTVDPDAIDKARNGKSFSVEGFDFAFDETISGNGWWATKPGQSGQCFVYLHFN